MKYPRIDKKELSKAKKVEFDNLLQAITRSIAFDSQENQLPLDKGDVDLLAWNAAVLCISMFITQSKCRRGNICADSPQPDWETKFDRFYWKRAGKQLRYHDYGEWLDFIRNLLEKEREGFRRNK